MITLFTQIQEAWDCNEWWKDEGEKYVLSPAPSQKIEVKSPPANPWLLGCAVRSWYILLCLCMCTSHTHTFLPILLWTLMPGALSKARHSIPQRGVQLLGSFPESKHCCIEAFLAFQWLIWDTQKPSPMRRDGKQGDVLKSCCTYLFIYLCLCLCKFCINVDWTLGDWSLKYRIQLFEITRNVHSHQQCKAKI